MSHVGSRLLAEVADRTTLTAKLPQAGARLGATLGYLDGAPPSSLATR